MTRSFYFMMFLSLGCIGCERQSTVQPSTSPAQTVSATNLVATMQDDEILRAIGQNQPALRSHRQDGKDGYSMIYSNEMTLVLITRSLVSGVTVTRLKPEQQKQQWTLGKP